MAQRRPVLEASRLYKAFDGNDVLHGASWRFKPGCLTAIVGLNGTGKTTLLDLLCGIAVPDDGDVKVNGRTITGLQLHRVFSLGISRLFQDIRIFATLTVTENVLIAMPRQPCDGLLAAIVRRGIVAREEQRRSQAARELLETVGLSYRADAHAEALSNGEQRLLAISRLLASDAPILLLDEPCSGIKADLAQQIMGTLSKESRAGRVVVVVEHDLDLVVRFADTILVLGAGILHNVSTNHIKGGAQLSALMTSIN